MNHQIFESHQDLATLAKYYWTLEIPKEKTTSRRSTRTYTKRHEKSTIMDDNITLQDGLAVFHKKNSKYFSERIYTKKGDAFLRNHDVAHVVFGCDTSIYGEGVVKVWTTFGTTLSFWKVISGYNEVNAFELFRMYSFRHISKNIFRFLGAIPKTIVRAKAMSKPWPFSAYESYLNTPISEVRKEFNIQVL